MISRVNNHLFIGSSARRPHGARLHRLMRSTVAVVISGAMVFVSAPAAMAAEEKPVEPSIGYQLSVEQQKEIDAVASATDSEERTFDAEAARLEGVDASAIADYAVILESAGWTISGAYDPSSASELALQSALACKGVSKYTGYFIPIGFQWALNSCDTDTFIAALKVIVAGGSATAAVALLTKVGAPVAAVAAAVAGIAGLGVAVTEFCKTASPKKAVYINAGGTIPASCWGQ